MVDEARWQDLADRAFRKYAKLHGPIARYDRFALLGQFRELVQLFGTRAFYGEGRDIVRWKKLKARPSRGESEGNNMPPRSECMSQSASATVFGGQQVSSYGCAREKEPYPYPSRHCAHCSRDHTPQSPPGYNRTDFCTGR
jgi:hypothetical protein